MAELVDEGLHNMPRRVTKVMLVAPVGVDEAQAVHILALGFAPMGVITEGVCFPSWRSGRWCGAVNRVDVAKNVWVELPIAIVELSAELACP
jgi:hypothetical protein